MDVEKLGCDDEDENEEPARGCTGDKLVSPLSDVVVVLLPPDALRILVSPFCPPGKVKIEKMIQI